MYQKILFNYFPDSVDEEETRTKNLRTIRDETGAKSMYSNLFEMTEKIT